MKYLYNFGILIYVFLVRVISPFNSKARLWTNGRKEWKTRLKGKVSRDNTNIWIHCASLGEFEQGRPLIEAVKKTRPEYRIILTFFSPSGYEIRKDYQAADYVCYLPSDTPGNAREFIHIVNPAAVIFVKYEFWDNYTLLLKRSKIPLYLISGIFRKDQHFFKWYGGFFRKMLFRFSHFFVQDVESMDLLKSIGIENITVAGDTRFDRVVRIADTSKSIPQIESFRGGEKLFLAGSSWHQDEEIISRYINQHPGKMKWVFAPHEIEESNIVRLEKLFSTKVARFSEFTEESAEARVMIIDNIGMLSSAYRYAYIAEIGGGFGKGIHNVLEAACWGIPVLFGQNHKKFREAVELLALGGARCFYSYEDFSGIIDNWLTDSEEYLKSAASASEYVKQNTGATNKILSKISLKDINNPFS
ncbi:MAG TPA: 3-deoxy-D-manno-octulosonic acid transferase [Bacteroidales bacterium]|jgi:3-deoxy-D-manno-octulosonic-acid transferase|nr:3-deoxy-D-manno-octulosonic acid transferase [Bacteroidales bacterium]HBZ20331.1 3-deoxy-D-manno-octulosonic acid transferase [Bacteroidales bacterium]